MNNNTIFKAIKTQLENASGLSYVKQILSGNRTVESITTYPTIILEPVVEDENQQVYPKCENKFTVQLIGLINVTNADKQITGDTNTKGILDFVNDVKTAIDADYTLGGTASHLVMLSTQYSSELYPVRMFALEIEVWFVQTKGNRV
jgi:hypothetical protein